MIVAEVTPLPSGTYGAYRPEPARYETAPVVQVAQLINGNWHGTPARYYASTLVALAADARLAIDYGQGWHLTQADTAALVTYAQEA